MGVSGGGNVEEDQEGLESGEGHLDAEKLSDDFEGVALGSEGEEPKGGNPEDSGNDSDDVTANEEEEAETEDDGEGFEGGLSGFFGTSSEDEGGSEESGSGVSGTGDEEDAATGDGGHAAAIGIDVDVVGDSSGSDRHEGVCEFVEVGVEVSEGDGEIAGNGDGPEDDAGGRGEEEEFLGFGHRSLGFTTVEGWAGFGSGRLPFVVGGTVGADFGAVDVDRMFAWVEGIVGVGLFEDGVGADAGDVGTAPFGGVERGFGPALAHVVADSALDGGSCTGEIGWSEGD